LIRVSSGQLFSVHIYERILLLESIDHRPGSVRSERSKDTQFALGLGLGDDLVVAGKKTVSPGFSLRLGLD
jgi:hypothetical protein